MPAIPEVLVPFILNPTKVKVKLAIHALAVQLLRPQRTEQGPGLLDAQLEALFTTARREKPCHRWTGTQWARIQSQKQG